MQVSQYLCSECGSVLKETAEYIPIHSLREECPSCGSMLAESLTRRTIRPAVRWTPPKIQTADTLLKLRFDIAKIDSFIGLAAADLCCVTGYSANLVLTRVCVRSLLPERHGGLNSPYVMVADVGHRSDVYRAINFARQYGMDKEKVADRILVVRAFTVPQVKRLLSIELFHSENRYRDVAFGPDGLTIYAITDSAGPAQAIDGGATTELWNPGSLLVFRYEGGEGLRT